MTTAETRARAEAARPATRLAVPRRSHLATTLRGIYIVWYRDLVRFWRDRARLAASFAQPLLFLVVFGIGLGSSLSGGIGGAAGVAAGLDYAQYIFPGIMAMTVLFSAIFGAMSIVWDREFGFLKEVLVAPVDRSAVAIGKSLGAATQAMIQGLILLVLAPVIGIKLTLPTIVLIVPLLFVLAFALASLGVAIATRMRTMQGFQVVMNFLLMPLFFLSGALFPLTNLPEWMTILTRLDPVAYGIDPLRRVMLTGAGVPDLVVDKLSLTIGGQVVPIWAEVGLLLVFGVVLLGVGIQGLRRRD